jgi:hypothetical protein
MEILKENLSSYSFDYLGWNFKRYKKYWNVGTTPEFGFSKEQGMELHNTIFPFEMFDEPMCDEYGYYIRLAGHAGCPSPEYKNGLWLEEDKCILYHIDNQCAFNFFIKSLKKYNSYLL